MTRFPVAACLGAIIFGPMVNGSRAGDADDRPTEEVAFYYNKISFEYVPLEVEHGLTLGGDSTFPALPADFFGPGSLPFSGNIPLKGSKIHENAISIERTSGFSFGTPPTPQDIFSEVSVFNLESLAPINVNFSDGSTQQWDVMVSGRQDENSSCWIRVTHSFSGEPDGGTILTDGTFFDVFADVTFSHTPASGPRRFRGFAIIDRTQLATSDAKWAHQHNSIAGGAYREFIPGADPADPSTSLQILFFDGAGLDLPLRVIDVVPEPASIMLVVLGAAVSIAPALRWRR